jgi:hypothetical protein
MVGGNLSFAKGEDTGPWAKLDDVVIFLECTEIRRHVVDIHEGVPVHPSGPFEGWFHPPAIADQRKASKVLGFGAGTAKKVARAALTAMGGTPIISSQLAGNNATSQ